MGTKKLMRGHTFTATVMLILLVFINRAGAFTPMIPVPVSKVLNLPANLPGGNFSMTNLFDGKLKSEYASRDEGTNTVVSIEFAKPTPITAVRHVDRNDGATVARSELVFLDANDREIASVPVTHANKRSGDTIFILPKPIEAQRLKWRVTSLGNKGLFSVGGAELQFFTSAPNDTTPARDTIAVKVLPFVERNGQRPLKVTIEHPYQEEVEVEVAIGSGVVKKVNLKPGENVLDWSVPEVTKSTGLDAQIRYLQNLIASSRVQAKPARPMTIYMLPHSHTDIGYTEIQSAVEKKQIKNVADGMAAARKTANYPKGSRFVWNVEVAWAADLYLERMNDAQREDFFKAVKNGEIALNGMYLNELTGLCRPEELIQLFRFATIVSEKTGVPVDAAMISDVPGYTWGTVTAMSQAGIKYLSAAPNYFDRIGSILKEWENKPFYWVGPDGKSKVLVWIPFWGYAMSHIYNRMSPTLISDFYDGIEKRNYPYDMAYVRWAGHGDNAVPDPEICDFVRDWNARYQWPQFVISGVREAFVAFEKQYGRKLPQVQGDWTPYWEDGAGSSALQTSENRFSSDRLSQAATAYALLRPNEYPVDEFKKAWRNTLLYSEHTWGAWCSISEPDRKETIEQWEVKKAYADQAREGSKALLTRALGDKEIGNSFNVVNTLSWSRTELVALTAEQSKAGNQVKDAEGKEVPSQRLKSGELVFLASDVQPYSAKRYTLSAGPAYSKQSDCKVSSNTLENSLVRLKVDEKSGTIIELSGKGIEGNLVDTSGGAGLNDYLYMMGDDTNHLQTSGVVTLHIGEQGPLVCSLIIDSDAPGCRKLQRELRIVSGLDYVEVINRVDKARLEAKSYYDKEGKESVNFGFPFKVPNGDMWVDVAFAAVRPEEDQIASACKNWLTVNRWVDVANTKQGVTWVTLDAPLIEVGGITANLLNSQTNPDVWRKKIDRTQKFYSWAMNNHWGTNYRARQEGETLFRFILRPHRGPTEPAAATRFATGFSHPLLAASSAEEFKPMLKLSTSDVVVTGLKPSDDKNAWIIRMFGASGKDKSVSLNWGGRKPKALFLSGTGESAGEKIGDRISVPGYGLVTLRAEF